MARTNRTVVQYAPFDDPSRESLPARDDHLTFCPRLRMLLFLCGFSLSFSCFGYCCEECKLPHSTTSDAVTSPVDRSLVCRIDSPLVSRIVLRAKDDGESFHYRAERAIRPLLTSQLYVPPALAVASRLLCHFWPACVLLLGVTFMRAVG